MESFEHWWAGMRSSLGEQPLAKPFKPVPNGAVAAPQVARMATGVGGRRSMKDVGQ
jgi:hypothetical protein